MRNIGQKQNGNSSFRVIVAGSRGFNNYELLKSKLDALLINYKTVVIVSGTAKGADSLGERYAKERGLSVARFPAKWDLYGKSAGYIRNQEMAKNADALVAFWDGKSKGTKHMIDIAKDARLQVRVVVFKGKDEV